MNTTADRTPAIPALSNQGGQANVPGIRRLWLIESRYVLQLIDPRTVAGVCDWEWVLPAGGLILSDDAPIYDWRFPASWGNYEEKATVSVQGVQYDQTIKLTLPRDNRQVSLAVMRMNKRRWVIIHTDANDMLRVVGTPKQPLLFSNTLSIGNNDRTLTWSAPTKLPATFLSEADTLLLTSFLSFQSDFSRI